MARLGEPQVRPIVAIAGAAILVLLALFSYFVPTGFQQQGALYQGYGPGHAGGGGAAVVSIPSEFTFLPNIPVNVSVSVADLPAGALAAVYVIPCPVGVTNASACATGNPQFLLTYNLTSATSGPQSFYLHFNVNVGHAFVISTTIPRGAQASYTATAPLWALQTWPVVVLLVVGIVLVGVGLSHASGSSGSSAYYGESAGYGPTPMRRFCESCGSRYTDESTMYCTNCGAPRM